MLLLSMVTQQNTLGFKVFVKWFCPIYSTVLYCVMRFCSFVQELTQTTLSNGRSRTLNEPYAVLSSLKDYQTLKS